MVTDNLGPRLARRPLHMFWLLDVSGSMGTNGKIDGLNDAMRTVVDSVREATKENPGVQVLMRVITFAHDASWHVREAVDVEEFEWSDVEVVERGTTELGLAIDLATEAIREVGRANRGLPPALILVSDGKPTDFKAPSFGASLRALAEEPWGRKASRMAIGIGQDADMNALHQFIGHDEIQPLRAGNAAELRNYLRWASTVVVDDRSRPLASWHDGAEPARSPGDSAAATVPSVADLTERSTPRIPLDEPAMVDVPETIPVPSPVEAVSPAPRVNVPAPRVNVDDTATVVKPPAAPSGVPAPSPPPPSGPPATVAPAPPTGPPVASRPPPPPDQPTPDDGIPAAPPPTGAPKLLPPPPGFLARPPPAPPSEDEAIW